MGALRERITLENQLADAQRDVTQTRLIDEEASVAHQQALREYYRVLNAGSDALRAAQDDLRVNERARELAARRVLDLNERRAAAGDAVTDALLDEVRAAETHLATLRAERAELELTLAATVRLQEAYQALAEGTLTAARRDNPFAELILSADELNQELDRVAADGVSNLADGLAELVVRGKADFRDLAESILQDLLRVFIQATIVNNLVAGLGLGGTGGGLGAIFGNIFHEGGRTEEGGRRRQLRGGLRPDELFAILQKGEVVVPRHLAPHLLSGNFDALRGWLARLPRFHEGGVAGGGHLDREDIVRLTAVIEQLSAVVTQLSSVVTRLGGGEPTGPSGGFIETPAGMGGEVERVVDEATGQVESFVDRAGNTLRGFFLEDIPGYAEQARQLIDEQLAGDGPGPQSRQPPFLGLSRVTREFERQRERDEARAAAAAASERRDDEGVLGQRVQELLERAREPVDLRDQIQPSEDSRRTQELLEDSNRILEEIRSQRGEGLQDIGAPVLPGGARGTTLAPGDYTLMLPQGAGIATVEETAELRGLFDERLSRQIEETQAVEGSLGEAVEILRELGGRQIFREDAQDETAVFRERFGRLPAQETDQEFIQRYQGFFDEQRSLLTEISTGQRRVADTPRPDLFPDDEDSVIRFREQSNAAFTEAGGLLTSVFSASGTMGQVTGESQGLLNDLFSRFGGQLTNVLNDVLGSVGGQGIGSVLGSIFGFHEGTGGVGGGAKLYHRAAGLRSDELLAVLQRGEIVLPRDMAQRLRTGGFHSIGDLYMALSRLPRFHEGGTVGGGGGGFGGMPTRIELINTTSTPIETVDNGQRVDAGQRVVSLILRDIRRNGPITQANRVALGRR